MNKLSRKELKTDHFIEEVGHSVEYVSSHRKPFVWAGIGAYRIPADSTVEKIKAARRLGS